MDQAAIRAKATIKKKNGRCNKNRALLDQPLWPQVLKKNHDKEIKQGNSIKAVTLLNYGF